MKITVAIPTRERAQYLRASLATCVAINDPDLEIVVSDNASADDTAAVVAATSDRRVRYVNTGARVSMRQNFEYAVNHSSGDYVMLMGDDDGMLPRQFPVLKEILRYHRPPALAYRPLYYVWPSPRASDLGGRLKIGKRHVFGRLAEREVLPLIDRVRHDRVDRNDFLPMIYHGMIRRDVIAEMRKRTGAVFSCSVPDVYFYVAALAILNRFLTVEHPFSIQGIGFMSTGVDARQGQITEQSPAERFACEAATDLILDPIPGRLPVIEMYYLNAIEQANRVAFNGKLQPDYVAYLKRIGKGLAAAGGQKQKEGLQILGNFVASLPETQSNIAPALSQIATLSPSKGDTTEGIRRWTLPSYATGSKLVIDLKKSGDGTIAEASEVADSVLGPCKITDDDTIAGRWSAVLLRALKYMRF